MTSGAFFGPDPGMSVFGKAERQVGRYGRWLKIPSRWGKKRTTRTRIIASGVKTPANRLLAICQVTPVIFQSRRQWHIIKAPPH